MIDCSHFCENKVLDWLFPCYSLWRTLWKDWGWSQRKLIWWSLISSILWSIL